MVNRLIGFILGGVLAAASTWAFAADLADPDAGELRQRAQELHNQRSHNPDFQPGQGRGAAPAAAPEAKPARAGNSRSTVQGGKETRRQKVAKKARSLKQLPGAFVRDR